MDVVERAYVNMQTSWFAELGAYLDLLDDPMASSDYRQVTAVVQRLGGLLNPVRLVASVAELVGEISVPPPCASSNVDMRNFDNGSRRPPSTRLTSARCPSLIPPRWTTSSTRSPTWWPCTPRAWTRPNRAAGRFADVAGRARVAAGVAGGLPPREAAALADAMVSVPGIGDGYDDGILSLAQLRRAGRSIRLSPPDAHAFADLLDRAGSESERAWLYKALAADHELPAIAEFADRIRGQEPAWLDGHLSLIDKGGPALSAASASTCASSRTPPVAPRP
jgi:hypothetical protein